MGFLRFYENYGVMKRTGTEGGSREMTESVHGEKDARGARRLLDSEVLLMVSYIKTLLLEVGLVLVCQTGDYILTIPASRRVFIALSDNLCHGLVGGISWAIVCDIQMTGHAVGECILCLLLAMFVDVDHFIAAKSFNLQAALSLPVRPPFHSTSLIFIVDILLIILSYVIKSKKLQLLSMIFTVAWLSHHVRDAFRRGLWFYPIGETSPLPRLVYLGFTVLFPLLMRLVYTSWRSQREKSSVPLTDV